MSFDIFLSAFREGQATTADVTAAQTVLHGARYHHEPDAHVFGIEFEDGSSVELFAAGLDGDGEAFDGGMFAVRGMSDAIGAFIFEFARAAGCAILPAMDPPCVLLPRDDLAAHLPQDLRNKLQWIPVSNGAELVAALNGGYEAWRAYRDRVLRTRDDAK